MVRCISGKGPSHLVYNAFNVISSNMFVFNDIADHGVALIQHFKKALEKGEMGSDCFIFYKLSEYRYKF
jgi:hypothetical protein